LVSHRHFDTEPEEARRDGNTDVRRIRQLHIQVIGRVHVRRRSGQRQRRGVGYTADGGWYLCLEGRLGALALQVPDRDGKRGGCGCGPGGGGAGGGGGVL
jgi:hypothetical protein